MIICDIDNCISDDGWRQWMIRRDHPEGDAKYHDYHIAGQHDDFRPCPLLGVALATYPVLFNTTRPNKYRDATLAWLGECGLLQRCVGVLMRPDNDVRPSTVVKVESARKWLAANHPTERPERLFLYAFDDRTDILAAYHSGLGIRTVHSFIHKEIYIASFESEGRRDLARDGKDV